MKPRNKVERFLLEEYGYGRLEEALNFIRKHKDGLFLSEIGQFFDGTILGTYKGYVKRSKGFSRYARPQKSPPYPCISKFWTSEKILKACAERGYSLSDIPYHLSNWDFWHGLTRNEVRSYVENLKNTGFPFSRISIKEGEKQSEKWEFQLLSDEFAFYVTGSSASNTKTIIVDFNTGEDFVDEINEQVSEYYRLIDPRNLKLRPKPL